MNRRCALFTVLALLISNSFGNSMMQAVDKTNVDKQQAAIKIESTFAPSVNEVTLVKTNNKVDWNNSGLQVSINNNWQITIKSVKPIHIEKIKISIDNDIISNQVNLDVSSDNPAKYLFSTNDFYNNIKTIISGNTLLGIVQKLNIEDYSGYKWYSFKKVNLEISYLDSSKNDNVTTTKFIMVLGR